MNTTNDIKTIVLRKQEYAYSVLSDPLRATTDKETQKAAQCLVQCAHILTAIADVERRYIEEVSNLAAKADQI